LRHGKRPSGAGQAWTKKYVNWIRVHVRFEHPAQEATLAHYIEEVDHIAERIQKLEQAIDEAVAKAAPEIRAVIEALQALRGVAQTTAVTVVCEVGRLSRFSNPRQLMGYSGLVPREHSSGNRVQRGAITKTGNAHLRRVLVEAAWTYQHRPNVQGRVLRRQKTLELSEEAKKIAWKAQQRLHKRFTTMVARGKNNNVIVTALARELLGFMWAIAAHTEASGQPTKAA
jgi:transposase